MSTLASSAYPNLSAVSPNFADIINQETWNKTFFKFASKASSDMAAEIIGMTKKYAESFAKSEGELDSTQATVLKAEEPSTP